MTRSALFGTGSAARTHVRGSALVASNRRQRARTREKRASLSALLGIVVLAFAPAIVVAEEKTCRGELGAATVDNLRVPDGATCTLRRTHIKGTIKVQSRAALHARGVRVVGNVQAENARLVSVTESSRIGGSVQVKQGGSAEVLDTFVQGDIQYEANSSSLRVNGNEVRGNVQVIGNHGRAEIYRNVIGGNLQCKENGPRPAGGRNKVRGNKEDQCSAF